MIEWASENGATLITITALVVPTVIQISPIKVNPWSALAKAIGRALNGEMLEEVKRLQDGFDKHVAQDAEDKAKSKRMRVLRFNDELIQGVRHTKEHFDEILDDITGYEQYCSDHKEYKNNKAVMAIENVKRIYRRCEEDNSFL